MTNTILQRLVNFNTERQLDKQDFDLEVASMNILEELLEAHGVHDDKDRIVTKELYRDLLNQVNIVKMFQPELFQETTEHDMIDAFCDIQVFAFGEPLKMDYNPILCLAETEREISSRTGEIINGKFTKYKTPEAIAKWYKADFNLAKGM